MGLVFTYEPFTTASLHGLAMVLLHYVIKPTEPDRLQPFPLLTQSRDLLSDIILSVNLTQPARSNAMP